MSIAYIPLTSLPSTRSETTSFDQVYGVRRRRPTSINLRLSNTHRWSGSDIDRQRETFYTAQSMADLARPTAVTPPSSDYTDAYLSAFALQPISTRYLHRVAAPRFIPAPLSHHLIRTSPTRFNQTTSRSASSFLSQTIPAEAPPQPILHESVEREPSSTTLVLSSIRDRPESPYENLPESMSSPMTVTYKPCVSFRSPPLPFVKDLSSSSTTPETVLPSLPTREKLDRPETILFQHDEDIQSSPVVSPMLDSPLTSEPMAVERRSSLSEEPAPVSSKPIKILENTLSKYESIINQISEVLASVSPLSSTISSMSPGKSALDYDLSSDSSPILLHRSVETNTSPTTSATTTARRTPASHLIRGDSYDKIVTAIADLDKEITPPPESTWATTTIDEGLEETLDESSAVSTIVEEPPIAADVIIDSTVLSPIELVSSSKKNDKRVTWDETVVDNEDDESLSSETSTHELSSTMSGSHQPEPQNITNDEQIVSMDPIGQGDDDVFISEMTDSSLIASESTTTENQTSFSTSPDTSSSLSDSLEHPTPTSATLDNNNLDLHTDHLQITPVESEWMLVTNTPSPSKPVADDSLKVLADVNPVVVDVYEQSNEVSQIIQCKCLSSHVS